LAEDSHRPGPARPDAAPQVPSFASSSAELAHAGALFRRNCQSCHAPDGSGAKVRKNMPEIPDFSSPDWQAERSEFALVASIRDGKGTFMPAFADRLTDTEIRQLVAYVRALDPPADGTKPAPSTSAAKTPATDFDKRFHKLQEERQALRAQFEALTQSAAKK